jgi:Ni,Fe-hydrogenase III small subunit
MTQWVWRGLRTGIKTGRYPEVVDEAAGVSPGLPLPAEMSETQARALAERCPTRALRADGGRVLIDYRRCVHCFRCARGTPAPLPWDGGYEWAAAAAPAAETRGFAAPFARSLHILVVDAGDCGACLNEVRQLNNPYYNMHRLGFFITPTPRQADVLLVVGPVTDHMRLPLRKAYEAMPTPRRVLAVGACALSGGVFGPSFVAAGGVGEVLPVDVAVPGHPPPPLAILHGLLVLAGRRPPAILDSPPGMGPDDGGAS